ncbi:unnamed protein product, partial [Discosporangium mesarthrocarpum]
VNINQSHRAPGCPPVDPSLSVNHHNTRLWEGAETLGLRPQPVPRNAQGCRDCGSCPHGCAFGAKRSTQATWLQDGLDSGLLTIIPNAEVHKVTTTQGRATGVTATVTPPGGGQAS